MKQVIPADPGRFPGMTVLDVRGWSNGDEWSGGQQACE